MTAVTNNGRDLPAEATSGILQRTRPVGQITATLAFANCSRTIPSLDSVTGRVSSQWNFTRNPAFTASCALHNTQ